MLDIEQIQKILPQRFPFLMIDRVEELDPAKRVVAVKNVTINEGFFAGHFPGRPIMPGALIIEAMAQAAIILFFSKSSALTTSAKNLSYYLGSAKVRFFHSVAPGDQLRIIVEPIKMLSGLGIIKASAKVGEKEVASGEISVSVKED